MQNHSMSAFKVSSSRSRSQANAKAYSVIAEFPHTTRGSEKGITDRYFEWMEKQFGARNVSHSILIKEETKQRYLYATFQAGRFNERGMAAAEDAWSGFVKESVEAGKSQSVTLRLSDSELRAIVVNSHKRNLDRAAKKSLSTGNPSPVRRGLDKRGMGR